MNLCNIAGAAAAPLFRPAVGYPAEEMARRNSSGDLRKILLILALLFGGFHLTARAQITLSADGPGNTYELINSRFGSGAASEVPDCAHPAFGRHISEVFDAELGKNVFVFHIHTVDNDRCSTFDRERNEIKGGNGSPAGMKHTQGEMSYARWKFRLDANFVPSSRFTHIMQIKALDGDAGAPLMTLTPRTGNPERMEVIHSAGEGTGSLGRIANVNLAPFKGTWVEAFMTYRSAEGSEGTFSLVIKRVSDGATLLSVNQPSVDMWRTGASFNREKWGIYRGKADVLRDEDVRFADFCVAETSAELCPSSLGVEALQITTTPGLLAVAPGNPASYNISVVAANGVTGPITMSVTGLPAHVAAGFSPAALAGSGATTLSIITSNATPLGSYPLTIRAATLSHTNSTAATLLVGVPGNNVPGMLWWTGGDLGLDWAAGFNWTNVTAGGFSAPGPANHLLFTNTATATAAPEITSVVADSLTVASVQYRQAAGFHTTEISDGATLTISNSTAGNALWVSTLTNDANQTITASIVGAEAALVVNNPNANLNVRQGGVAGNHRATLDLSGLNSFHAAVGRVFIAGDGGSAVGDSRLSGVLYLARTNTIITSGAAPQINSGDHPSNGRGNPPITLLPSFLFLGQSNAIFTDSITVGRQKAAPVSMLFNPAFLAESPMAFFRGMGGGNSRVSLWAVGDNLPLGSSNQATEGTNDFTGGTVDALIDVLRLGTSCNGNNTGSGTGVVTFASGLIDVNTLQLGYQTVSSGASGNGTINVNATAHLIVNTSLQLARVAGGVGGAVGTLNINGGTVTLKGSALSLGGLSAFNVNGGTVNLTNTIGAPGAPVTAFNLTNATLRLRVSGLTTNLVVTTMNAAAVNTFDIAALPTVTEETVFPLLAYSGFNGSVADHFTLGSLPAGYTGMLVENIASKRIDLVVTPAVPPHIGAISVVGTNLLLSGDGGIAGWPYYVRASTNLALPWEQWPVVLTNVFDAQGGFSVTNAMNAAQPQHFYLLQLP